MLLCVAVVESYSHRQVLGPILSDVAITMMLLLVFLIVFEGWLNRLVAFVGLATAVAAVWAHNVLPPSYPEAPLRLVYHSAALVLVGFATLVILRNIFEQRVVRVRRCAWRGVRLSARSRSLGQSLHADRDFLARIVQRGPGVRRSARHLARAHRGIELCQPGSLTSIGSGAVVPVQPPATVLTTLEAVFGQFYIAVVVAQLVGARLSQSSERTISPQA